MAAEAADGPSPPPPPMRTGQPEAPAAAEKRSPADRDQEEQGAEERPEPKRRRARARITALESVPRAAEVAAAAAAASAAAEAEAASREDESEPAGGCDGGESFSFHARGFSSAQTTPKFGSFNNPGATTELVAFHLMKASRRRVDPPATEEPSPGGHRTVAGGNEAEAAAEGSDGNSR